MVWSKFVWRFWDFFEIILGLFLVFKQGWFFFSLKNNIFGDLLTFFFFFSSWLPRLLCRPLSPCSSCSPVTGSRSCWTCPSLRTTFASTSTRPICLMPLKSSEPSTPTRTRPTPSWAGTCCSFSTTCTVWSLRSWSTSPPLNDIMNTYKPKWKCRISYITKQAMIAEA